MLATDTLLTAAEAARKLRISRRTLYAMISRGDLRASRLGPGPCARVRVASSELDRYLNADRAAADGDD